ncbi:RNA polymerase sigma factor [Dyadobacter diqingensis]|uniref:RNA polymerase sigma factor n=1 Tax=Dyadobacter diqingensis TaxID=2938121 RepID=UPI0020C234A1|nr:sigma-70 family RNA polymerase sigma factor [Dyadobacter diqingensis]
MKKPILSDQELLMLLSEGSGEAFEILFDHYYSTLVRVLMRYSKDAEQIKDWIQEVYVKLWENREQIKANEIENFTGYLIVSARNHAIRALGKKKQLHLILNDQMSDYEVADNNLAENLDQAELLEAYHVALSKMPPRTQEAYFLNREKGLTYSRVAEELGTSIKTVEAQISRAMAILRRELVVFLR